MNQAFNDAQNDFVHFSSNITLLLSVLHVNKFREL